MLVVDDNHDAADTLAALVDLWGYETRVAYDSATALVEADRYRPDCLLLDIGMPKMDGYSLAREVRRKPDLRSARLVAVSAYAGEQHQHQAREAGFDYTVTKPANPAELKRLLDMLAQALKLAERTEALAQQNVELARETKELLMEVKDELREVKDEIREVKDELREVKEERGD
jgi:CheY-like chemotaxis protein